MRNLATIQIVKSVDPIEGKDRIGIASFKDVGFRVIVGKETKVGDKVVYFEMDSLLPPRPEFEFLRERCWNEKWQGHRIRAMRMGGVYSEGLAIPVEQAFPSEPSAQLSWLAGKDVTEKLGVRKYDPEAQEEREKQEISNKKRGPFMRFLMSFWIVRAIIAFFHPKTSKQWPAFLSKTDETRVQSLSYVFNKTNEDGTVKQEQLVSISEKLDGQSATYAIYKKKLYVCSRNFCLKKDDSKYWQVAIKYDIEAKLRKARKDYGFDIAIQAENCGPAIQGNKYGFSSVRPFLFNVYNIRDKVYFGRDDLEKFAKTYGLETVPLLETCSFHWQDAKELERYADGFSVFGKNVLREGVVIRSFDYKRPEKGMSNMWSFKVISPSFIIKHLKG